MLILDSYIIRIASLLVNIEICFHDPCCMFVSNVLFVDENICKCGLLNFGCHVNLHFSLESHCFENSQLICMIIVVGLISLHPVTPHPEASGMHALVARTLIYHSQ